MKFDPWERPWKKTVELSKSVAEMRDCLIALYRRIEPACLFTKAKTPRQMVAWTDKLPQLPTFSALHTHIEVLEDNLNSKGKTVKPAWDPLAFAPLALVDQILEISEEDHAHVEAANASPKRGGKRGSPRASESPPKKRPRAATKAAPVFDFIDDGDHSEYEEEEEEEEAPRRPTRRPVRKAATPSTSPKKGRERPKRNTRTVLSDDEDDDDDDDGDFEDANVGEDTIVIEVSRDKACSVCHKSSGEFLSCEVCKMEFHPKCLPVSARRSKRSHWRCSSCEELHSEDSESQDDDDDAKDFMETSSRKKKEAPKPRKSQRTTRGVNGSLL